MKITSISDVKPIIDRIICFMNKRTTLGRALPEASRNYIQNSIFSRNPSSIYIMPMGDAIQSRAESPQNKGGVPSFFQQKKRVRTDTESDQEHSGTSTPNSLTPTLQLNDEDLSAASTVTIITNPAFAEREKEQLTFKLDKLNDKKCRYESHEAFLKKCLSNNLAPNGLRVYVEPSIGNRDDEFLTLWHSRLDEFSKTLTTDVIVYCENEIKNIKAEIADIDKKLKDLITPPEYSDISKAISANEQTRVNELVQRKNRKFYRLKYNNEDRRGNRYQEDRENTSRGEPWQQRNEREPRNWKQLGYMERHGQQGNQRNQQRGYVTNQQNHHDNHAHQRNGNQQRNPDEQQQKYEHRNQVLQEYRNEQNNDWSQENRNEHRSDRRPGTTYASVARNGTRGNLERNNGNSRRSSYRNLRPQTNQDIPLHERVSLHQRNSRRNLGNNNQKRETNKDQEIEELRNRLQELERIQPEQVLYHQTFNQDTNSKNPNEAQKTKTSQNTTELSDMKNFLMGVMQTISDFDKRLTTHLNTSPTHSDRS